MIHGDETGVYLHSMPVTHLGLPAFMLEGMSTEIGRSGGFSEWRQAHATMLLMVPRQFFSPFTPEILQPYALTLTFHIKSQKSEYGLQIDL